MLGGFLGKHTCMETADYDRDSFRPECVRHHVGVERSSGVRGEGDEVEVTSGILSKRVHIVDFEVFNINLVRSNARQRQ